MSSKTNHHQFSDQLAQTIADKGSPLCIGLDPVIEKIPQSVTDSASNPAAAFELFCKKIIDAAADLVPVVKPQSACFERLGSSGVQALAQVVAHARRAGLLVVLDAKRGDIGISARHYAAAATDLGAHAITLNTYLGMETLQPYLDASLGIFPLVRTSNPGSDPIQAAKLADGKTVAQLVASQVAALGQQHMGTSGLSDVGAVVGATKAAEGSSLRNLMPDQVFLVPGLGAQGGSANDLRNLIRPNQPIETAGILATASRSIIYAGSGTNWISEAADAAKKLADEVNAALSM